MSRKLTRVEAEDLGILHPQDKQRSNGELQARAVNNGLGVSATVLPEGAEGWQKAHLHESISEIYHVVVGAILLVEQTVCGTPLTRRLVVGEHRTVSCGVPHTVYVAGGTKFATIKHPVDPLHSDWHAVPELDAYIDEQGAALVVQYLR